MCEEATSTESSLLEERCRYITHVHAHTHTKASIRGESKKSEVEQCRVQKKEDYENETRRHVAK